ncbi:MAG: ribosome small subunit-dependent GTPase A [Coriobacteriia bacterium]|nr:ribosome small subunit-dependent GTPase A [Coriobacteriia bacterium]MBN2839369.1 ribosome small subunit-dependent GTPase A [Coriobacteriia bacterium]
MTNGGITLAALGHSPAVAALIATHPHDLVPGRVIRSDRGFAFVQTVEGLQVARPATRLVKSAADGGIPVVGDWVLLGGDEAEPLVEVVLERTTAIMRRDPGRSARVQVLAANVDVVFVTHPLAGEPNLSRIERELALVWDSGAQPVILLTKADLSDDAQGARDTVAAIAPGVDIHITSAATGAGIDEALVYLAGGRTAVLIGPSGSGKSTLVNALAGEDVQETREVRVADGRGRHTTVSRELIVLPGGGLIIDTPGLRAVGMWDSSEGLAQAFSDIDALAAHCRFRDCRHEGEPGCAVEAAVERGELAGRRLDSFRELQAEIATVNEQLDVRARLEKKREDKILARSIKDFYKNGDKRR